jgi:hypothetical protein
MPDSGIQLLPWVIDGKTLLWPNNARRECHTALHLDLGHVKARYNLERQSNR